MSALAHDHSTDQTGDALPARPFAHPGPTWLPAADYLEALGADADRLLELAAADLSAPVPGCPGWDVTDLVSHVASVYGHKVRCIETGRPPQPWPEPEVDSVPPLDQLAEQHRALQRVFATRDLLTPTWTWWAPDQSVGFWLRRLALETLVHRVDVEQALGRRPRIDPTLALDGVAEYLEMIIGDVAERDRPVDRLLTVRFESADAVWRLVSDRAGLSVLADDHSPAQVTVAADPATLLLVLWRRLPLSSASIVGEADAVSRLRHWLGASTLAA